MHEHEELDPQLLRCFAAAHEPAADDAFTRRLLLELEHARRARLWRQILAVAAAVILVSLNLRGVLEHTAAMVRVVGDLAPVSTNWLITPWGWAASLLHRRLAAAALPSLAPLMPRHGVARVISKLGLGSRTQAGEWVRAGRVRVNGRVVRDAEHPVLQGRDRIDIDGVEPAAPARLALMLNKPRGLVTTAKDERGRATVYRCFAEAELPWLAPIGRLDKASEGLLLFTNDPTWAAGITDPESGPPKTYHVQIDGLPAAGLPAALERGARVDGERLKVRSARALRSGAKTAWLQIVLEEGRNRQIRRLLEAFDVSVLRLVRVAIGPLTLGTLGKGQWRMLTAAEMQALSVLRQAHP